MTQQTFNELFNKNFERLDLYTRAITRAHGESHPEAFEVRELFEAIQEKINETSKENPELKTEFTKLRAVTSNYDIPTDVCETYASVYNMLADLDKAYQTE